MTVENVRLLLSGNVGPYSLLVGEDNDLSVLGGQAIITHQTAEGLYKFMTEAKALRLG